jgi:hypothetical protein
VLPVDGILTYDAMEELLGFDVRNRRDLVYRAIRALLEENERTLEAVPNQGYRVVYPQEHERLAHGYQRGAKRKITKAIRTTKGTNRNGLTQEERTRLDAFELNLKQQQAALNRVRARVTKVEQKTTQQGGDLRVLQAQMARMADQLGIDLDALPETTEEVSETA